MADLDNLYYYTVDDVVTDTSGDGLFQHCMEAWSGWRRGQGSTAGVIGGP